MDFLMDIDGMDEGYSGTITGFGSVNN